MKKKSKKNNAKKVTPAIEEIEKMADNGQEVDQYFSGKGKAVPAYKEIDRRNKVQRVIVDFPQTMVKELDATAENLYISRQAVIKTLIRHGLNQGLLDEQKKGKSKF
jgi:hypothetical protein